MSKQQIVNAYHFTCLRYLQKDLFIRRLDIDFFSSSMNFVLSLQNGILLFTFDEKKFFIKILSKTIYLSSLYTFMSRI